MTCLCARDGLPPFLRKFFFTGTPENIQKILSDFQFPISSPLPQCSTDAYQAITPTQDDIFIFY